MSPVTLTTGETFRTSADLPREEYTFSELIAGREDEFPVLALATANIEPAINPKIEWPSIHSSEMLGPPNMNYCEIVRVPYDGDRKDNSLTMFLSRIEYILVYGLRTMTGTTRTCGGVRYFLKRDLRAGDRISLRPLRSPTWRGEVQAPSDPIITHEWLCEFSMTVVPGNTKMAHA